MMVPRVTASEASPPTALVGWGTAGSGSGARCARRRTLGWSRTASMLGRCDGSRIMSHLTIFCMSPLYTWGSAGILPFITLNLSSSMLRASKGTVKVHISKRTQPSAQTSELKVYGLFLQTSGGM